MSKISNKLKQIKWYILFIDVLVICIVFFAADAWQSRNMLEVDSRIQVNQQLLMGLDGQKSSLIASDKPTLLYFFAPWCKVCSLSIGNLEFLSPDKINIVRVALDYSDIEELRDFAATHEISSQILLGNEELKQAFKIQGYPTYYIMDEKQKVLAKSYGYSSALGLKLRQVFSG